MVYEHKDDGNTIPVDEVDCFNDYAQIVVSDGLNSALVIGRYYNDTWLLGIAQVNEDTPVPKDWKISIVQLDRAYSPSLIIESDKDLIFQS